MTLKWILLLTAAILIPSIAIPMWNETKPKKNLILGVTLPHAAREDSYVLALSKKYHRWLLIVVAGLIVSAVPMFFLQRNGEIMMYFLIWMLLAVLAPYLPYIHYHRTLAAYKQQQGWAGLGTAGIVVDLKAIGRQSASLGFRHFLLPLLICFVPNVVNLIHGRTHFLAHSSALVTVPIILLFYALSRFINRQRVEVVDGNTSLSAALTQVRRHSWSQMNLYMAWLTALFFAALALFQSNSVANGISTVAYLVAIIILALRIETRVRSAQQKLTETSGQDDYVDEDRYWLAGMLYHNPNDRRVMVNNRTGTGMGINLGRPVGKAFMALSVAVLLSMPLMGTWFLGLDRGPMEIAVSTTAIEAYYNISLADIEQVSLMDSIPTGTVRTWGTGLDTLLEGNFAMPDATNCKFYLDPTEPPFIRIDTAQTTFVLGTRDGAATIAAYESILEVFS